VDAGADADDGGMMAMDASAGDAGGGGGLRRAPGCACRTPTSGSSGNGGLALTVMMAGLVTVMVRRRNARH
jgi:MYXO-CTERM domain-containing protein